MKFTQSEVAQLATQLQPRQTPIVSNGIGAIERSEHAAILARTSTTDLSNSLNALGAGVASGSGLAFPAGLYNANITLAQPLALDFTGAELRPVTNAAVVRIEGSVDTEVPMVPIGGIRITDAAVNTGSTTLTSAAGLFTAGMAGWIAVVMNTGTAYTGGYRPKVTTIAAYVSATQVTLGSASVNPSNVSGQVAWFFPTHIGYGTTQVEAVGLSLGIAAEDLVILADNSVRATDDSPINDELMRVKSVSEDVAAGTTILTFYGIVESEYYNYPVTVQKVNALKAPSIRRAVGNRNSLVGHTFPIFWFRYCEFPTAEDIQVLDSIGHCVRFEYCWGPKAERIRCELPAAVGGGEGYGVTFHGCKNIFAENIHGNGMRHVVDCDRTYGGSINDVAEINGQSSTVVLAHNGYGGNGIACRNVRTMAISYAVNTNGTALATGQIDMRVIRNALIENIQHTIPDSVSPDASMVTVYLQTDWDGCTIQHVRQGYLSTDSPTTSSGSFIVRVNGINKTACSILDIRSNKTGIGVWVERGSTADSGNTSLLTIDGVNIDECRYAVWYRGIINTTIANVRCPAPLSAILRIGTISSVTPAVLNILGHWTIPTTATFIDITDAVGSMHASGLRGQPPEFTFWSTVGLSLSSTTPAANEITIEKMIYASRYFPLVAVVGGNTTLDATTPFPAPIWFGQECRIAIDVVGVPGTRGDIIIPGGSATVADSTARTLADSKVYKFVGGPNRKWCIEE